MNLRVTVGNESWKGASRDGLTTLARAGSVLIEGDGDVATLSGADGARAFVAGTVVGVRGRNGRLTAVDSVRAAAALVLGAPRAQVRHELEGRYVAIRLSADGGGEVWADAYGRRDLYVHRGAQTTVFATDMRLLPPGATGGGYDAAAVAHTLCVFGFRPPKRQTFYRSVQRLGVGEGVTIRGSEVTIAADPWTPAPVAEYGEGDLHRYADILLEAVEARGSRHGNVVYLSSGWDSTSILACLVKIFGPGKVRAVIGRMQYATRSGEINKFELERAEAVARYYRVPLAVAELDYRKDGPEVLESVQGLFRGNHYFSMTGLNHAILAEAVARTTNGDEAVFGGEISDGVHNLGFSQYATYFHPVIPFREYFDKMAGYLFSPSFFELFTSDRFSDDPVYRLLRERAGDAAFDAPSADPVTRRRQFLASFFLRANRLPLWSQRNARLLTDAGHRLYESTIEHGYLDAAAREVRPETLYSWLLRLYNSFHWQGSTVATMAATAEARGLRLELPFWDGALHDYLSAMPETFGRALDLNPTKYPLKWTLANRVDYPLHLQVGPHSYLYDVDPSFSHGAEILYGSSLGPYFKSKLGSRSYRDLLGDGSFDMAYVDGVVDRYLGGTEVRGAEMNDLLTLSLLVAIGWQQGA